MIRRLFCLVLTCVLLLTACGQQEEGSGSSASSSEGASSAPSPAQSGQETAANTPFTLAACPSYSFHPVLAESSANLTL